MPAALICDAGTVSDPGGTFTACEAGQGSTFTVRNFALTSSAELVGLARGGATKGAVRVRSPYLSDNVQGIRYTTDAGVEGFLLPGSIAQGLQTQDSLTVEVTGGAAESDGALLSTYYDDLPGSNMRLKSPGDIAAACEYVTTWEVAAEASATIGAWGSKVLTTTYDESQANRWYALLGYTVDTAVLGVALNGPDTSNFNVGGPGVADPRYTRRYFADLSMDTGKPCIPCFNSANKSATNVQVADVAASTATNVDLVVAIMSPVWQP